MGSYLPGSITNSVQIVSATHSSLKATFLNPAPNVGTVRKAYIPKIGEGTRCSDCPGPALWSTGSHILSTTSTTHFFNIFPRERSIARKGRREG